LLSLFKKPDSAINGFLSFALAISVANAQECIAPKQGCMAHQSYARDPFEEILENPFELRADSDRFSISSSSDLGDCTHIPCPYDLAYRG
jgi:hypothetical protein